MKEIPLTRGVSAVVDDEDYDRLSDWKWCAASNWYACRRVYSAGSSRILYMHRFIMSAPEGLEVDHINGNPLDNRRANLRLATRSENRCNSRMRSDNKTGAKGVHRHGAKFRARIKSKNRSIHLGLFEDLESASAAYKEASLRLHGDFSTFANISN